jgi:serine kinase of HPr protein (carbohydrate metabolism regulator)
MLIHATCVAINGKAVLLTGPPGSGKSDLALRLIDGGAALVADDQTLLQSRNGVLTASAPASIAGMIELRHVGLIRMEALDSAPVVLTVDLASSSEALERLPEPDVVFLLDQRVQRLRLPAFAASTPAKIRVFLSHMMLS